MAGVMRHGKNSGGNKMAVVAGKSKVTAYLLWFFLGALSAHKFYLRKTGVGIL
jgi:TM2 domain-containing membrane protein YozV